jgi:hypothetical protein
MMNLTRLIVVVSAICTQSTWAQKPHFEFAGFTIETTLIDATARYPDSKEAHSYIYISKNNTHDHIYGISIRSSGIFLFLEKRLESGGVSYPLCRTKFDEIYPSYGGPDLVRKYNEEAMPVHLRIWKKGRERLALRCFEAEGTRYAERVELYLTEPGAN